MTPEQKLRLRSASLCPMPISASTAPKAWNRARTNVALALKGRNLSAGLGGAVFIESCWAMDRILVRADGSKVLGGAA